MTARAILLVLATIFATATACCGGGRTPCPPSMARRNVASYAARVNAARTAPMSVADTERVCALANAAYSVAPHQLVAFWPLRSGHNAGTGTTAHAVVDSTRDGKLPMGLYNSPTWGADGVAFVKGVPGSMGSVDGHDITRALAMFGAADIDSASGEAPPEGAAACWGEWDLDLRLFYINMFWNGDFNGAAPAQYGTTGGGMNWGGTIFYTDDPSPSNYVGNNLGQLAPHWDHAAYAAGAGESGAVMALNGAYDFGAPITGHPMRPQNVTNAPFKVGGLGSSALDSAYGYSTVTVSLAGTVSGYRLSGTDAAALTLAIGATILHDMTP